MVGGDGVVGGCGRRGGRGCRGGVCRGCGGGSGGGWPPLQHVSLCLTYGGTDAAAPQSGPHGGGGG